MTQNYKHLSSVRKPVDRDQAGLSFKPQRRYFLFLLVLLTILLQCCITRAQANTLLHAKNTLKLLQNPTSLVKLRHRRDTFANEQLDEANADYDDNYGIVPEPLSGEQPPSVADKISAQAQEVAESFKRMWQAIGESVHHCISAFRAIFGAPQGEEDLTPEQQEAILAELEAKYRLKQQHDNEI